MYVVVAAAVLLFVSGLLLMGFKPKSSLKRYHHVKPAHFIYPDEKVTRAPFTSSWSLVVWDSPPQSYLCSAIGRGGNGRRWGLRYCLAWNVMRVGSSVRGSDEGGGEDFSKHWAKLFTVHPNLLTQTVVAELSADRFRQHVAVFCAAVAQPREGRGAHLPLHPPRRGRSASCCSTASGALFVCGMEALDHWGSANVKKMTSSILASAPIRPVQRRSFPSPFPPSHFPPSPTLPSFLEPTRSPQRCAHRLLFH